MDSTIENLINKKIRIETIITKLYDQQKEWLPLVNPKLRDYLTTTIEEAEIESANYIQKQKEREVENEKIYELEKKSIKIYNKIIFKGAITSFVVMFAGIITNYKVEGLISYLGILGASHLYGTYKGKKIIPS